MPRRRRRVRVAQQQEGNASPPSKKVKAEPSPGEGEDVKACLEKEDAVAFLARMREQSPNVLSVLNEKQVKLLAKEPTEPYASNEEYLNDMAAAVNLKQRVDDSKTALRNALLQPRLTKEEVDVARFDKQTMVLKEIGDRLTAIVEARLQTTEDQNGAVALPRIIRLCRKFKFTENETKIAIHALVIQSGYGKDKDRDDKSITRSGFKVPPMFLRGGSLGRFAQGIDVLSLCQFIDIPLQEMLDFLSQDRLHMQQGFFPEVQQATVLSCRVVYDPDFCKALMGPRLKANEFLKLEQTFLADVIAEEPGNEHYRDENLGLVVKPLGVEGSGKEVTAPTAKRVETGEGGKEGEGMDATAAVEEEQEKKEKREEEGEEEEQEEKEVEEKEPLGGQEGGQPMAVPLAAEDKPQKKTEKAGGEGKDELGNDDIGDLDVLLRTERAREKKRKEKEGDATEEKGEDESSDKLKPYKTDLEYLDDHFQLLSFMMKVKEVKSRIEMKANLDDGRQDQRFLRQKREAESKAKVQEKKCSRRMALTRQAGTWVPRLERMVESRGLSVFEKKILLALIGSVIQPNKYVAHINSKTKVGEFLQIFCSGLEQQIAHRKYFYKSSTLVHEGMIVVHNSGLTGDQSSATVEIDRRMLDFCVGLDTEFSETVEGSHLYYPKTKFDQVILSKDQKDLILGTVSNFEMYKRCRKRMGLDDAITYGAGMVMLFHGPPGTGKTMMANALANKLEKKILLINFPSLGYMTAGENFKFIFRESKINDAILFFDECEAIFESREKGKHSVNLLLTEIERHDGLIIMATNRPYDLDEAMHRRIMVAIEFRQPDHLLRKAIWQSHLPEQMKLADDIDLDALSLRYELTGGFIKNAILSALSISVSRDGEHPIVCQKDLLQGANLQLRGRLRMKDFDRRVVPDAGLDEVIVEESVMRQLKEIVQFEKARSVLFGQWGFAKRNHQGLTILLHGAPGTGKTLAAEAIGYEVGKPLKMVNCGELLSKWVGDTTKNIDSIFQEAQHQDAILVFDEAEGLFGSRTKMSTSTDRYANVDVGVLLYHIERFHGIIILTTNLIENIDKAFFRRLRFVIQLDIPPRDLRVKLWKLIIPQEAPLSDDVDFERLARHEMTGGNIKSAIFRAAARAAIREDQRKMTMKDLEEAADEEVGKTSTRFGFRRQDSETSRMYN